MIRKKLCSLIKKSLKLRLEQCLMIVMEGLRLASGKDEMTYSSVEITQMLKSSKSTIHFYVRTVTI